MRGKSPQKSWAHNRPGRKTLERNSTPQSPPQHADKDDCVDEQETTGSENSPHTRFRHTFGGHYVLQTRAYESALSSTIHRSTGQGGIVLPKNCPRTPHHPSAEKNSGKPVDVTVVTRIDRKTEEYQPQSTPNTKKRHTPGASSWDTG